MKVQVYGVYVAALALAAALSSCGGGGGNPGSCLSGAETCSKSPGRISNSGEKTAAPATVALSAQAQPNLCAKPRTGSAYPDRKGSKDNEIAFVKAWMDKTYLWYSELPNISNPFRYASATGFFDVYKSGGSVSKGIPKGRFHFWAETEKASRFSKYSGVIGYGLTWKLLSSFTPRKAVLSYIDPKAGPVNKGLERGDEILSIDGEAFSNGDMAKLNAGLYPSDPGKTHRFTFRKRDGSKATISLTSKEYNETTVQRVRTETVGNRQVGYMQFNAFTEASEAELITAFEQLQADGAQELVLDLRYNGGGSVLVSSALAYMIAGSQQTEGKVFEQLRDNGKRPFGSDSNRKIPFYSRSNAGSGSGFSLPSLNLSRVYVLTTGDTCSASEAVINGLRGVDVEVVIVGDTTCGKPFGFYPQPNCGITYYAVQFQGVNAKGFGDYAAGFAPSCKVSDDFSHNLGERKEALFAEALYHIQNDKCNPRTASAEAARSVLAALRQQSSPAAVAGGQSAPGSEVRDPLRNLRNNMIFAP